MADLWCVRPRLNNEADTDFLLKPQARGDFVRASESFLPLLQLLGLRVILGSQIRFSFFYPTSTYFPSLCFSFAPVHCGVLPLCALLIIPQIERVIWNTPRIELPLAKMATTNMHNLTTLIKRYIHFILYQLSSTRKR
jgi:hypothetical protein